MILHCSMQLNMERTAQSLARLRRTVTVLVFVAVSGAGIAGTAAAPQLQPLSSQFVDARGVGYAPAYGYGGQAPLVAAAAVQVAKTERLYADAPSSAVHVGYVPTAVYKPDLSAYAAASFPLVEQLRRFDPVVRPVHTVVPKVTAVEPSVTVHKTYVDVPVYHPQYEYRPPVAVQDPSAPYYYHNNYQLLVDRK